tara:strand:+ start:2835 stop:3791 length:957 start_codon:yes stop_codon:yes gene_type:complete
MKKILIWGGTGQIGTHLIRKLTQDNHAVTVVTRNIHQKGHVVKTQGNAGYIEIKECSIFDEHKIRKLFESTEICINLIGILFEKKNGNSFKNIHSVFPSLLAKLCKEYKLKKFIHLSALGINKAIDSNYAQSKLNGEQNILKIFPNTTILRPSIVYSSSDNFSCNLMTLLSRLPIFPLYYQGNTKFTPIHCSDLTDIINFVISKKVSSNVIECIGPEVLTFKEILVTLLNSINKKRLLIPFPLPVAMMTAKFFQLLPNPLLTVDQLKLLKYDNVVSGKYKTNFDIGLPANKIFNEEIKKYSYMWTEGGEYSRKKDNSN